MWPYGGKKTFVPGYNGNVSLLAGTSMYPNKNRSSGGLDKEYFHQLTISVGMSCFTDHKLANDGRILSAGMRDVTNEFCSGDRQVKRREVEMPQKQLHQRNVDQLKLVLSLPDKKRRTSLTHIAGAIMRNEVAPSFSQLENDEFLNEHLAKTTEASLQHGKLPPLSRLPHDVPRLKTAYPKRRPSRRFPSLSHRYVYSNRDNGFDAQDAVRESQALSRENSSWDSMVGESKSNRFPQVDLNYSSLLEHQSMVERDSSSMETIIRPKLLSNDTTKTSEAISQQFRAIVQNQLIKNATEEAKALALSRENSDVFGDEAVRKAPSENSRNAKMGYKLRHEYGKNLERNWFKQFLQKSKKENKETKEATIDNPYGVRLDIFYSPEPQSDEEMEEQINNAYVDEASIQCGGFSTATAEDRSKFRRQFSRKSSQFFQRHETLEEQDETDHGSSGSDIEIIFKNDQLIQRKTKHKLRKKRQRQLERYKAFLPEDDLPNNPQAEDSREELPLTDQEIRAIRLNLRNKDRLKKLRGKRKFLQAANAVYIAVQFKNILQRIRKRKRRLIKQRQQRIAAMVAKRTALKQREEQEKDADDETEEEESDLADSRPSLRDIFMKELGQKLLYDIAKLNIDDNVSEFTHRESIASQKGKADSAPDQATSLQRSSRYAIELRKVSTKDAEMANGLRPKISRRKRKRRHSIPFMIRKPSEFLLEVPVKSKRRRDASKTDKRGSNIRQQKETRRAPSPLPKCSCFRHKTQAALSAQGSNLPKCQHQSEPKKPKIKIINIPTTGLMRTYSQPDLTNKQPIELRDLLEGIDFPAKEIKLQILARKFRRQRRKRQQIRLSPCRLPDVQSQIDEGSNSETDSEESDSSDSNDFDFVYGGPFVGSGVMWNQNSNSKRRTWTAEDVDREVKKITRIFHEMKECRYLRLDGFNDAIIQKLNENKGS